MRGSHNFDEKKKDVEPWVERLAEKIGEFMIKYNIRTIPYGTPKDIEIQRSGIDIIIKSKSSGWEAKIRSPKALKYYDKDILLETTSVKERNKPGWLYTSKADVIAYCWQNSSSTNLMEHGYFILLKELRQTLWFKRLKEIYHIQDTGSDRDTSEGKIYWRTEFVTPPIKDFPRGTLYRFNAILPSNYKQTIIPVGEGNEK